MKLAWQPPADDGGGKIQGYIVEVKPKDGDWQEAVPGLVKDTNTAIPVKPGQEYQFRVKAVNEAGQGSPSMATPLTKAEKPAG